MTKKLTLSEAQRTNQMDKFIRQQEEELQGKGHKGKMQETTKQTPDPPRKHTPFRTESVDLGHCLLPNVDKVAHVLAVVEGESLG